MKILFVIFYVVAAAAPALGLVLAIINTKRIIRKNDAVLKILMALNSEQIQKLNAVGWQSPEADALHVAHQAALIEAGAKTFGEKGGVPSIEEMSFAPNFVENMILKRLTDRVPIEIILIIAGLLCGAVASIWSLFLP
uniref:hypothetical protein n=1 Tax=Arthrobacter sp. TaxID=1667 RepID=UPI00159EDAC3|nr:hypothetical protein [Arthrobacter sp.]